MVHLYENNAFIQWLAINDPYMRRAGFLIQLPDR